MRRKCNKTKWKWIDDFDGSIVRIDVTDYALSWLNINDDPGVFVYAVRNLS